MTTPVSLCWHRTTAHPCTSTPPLRSPSASSSSSRHLPALSREFQLVLSTVCYAVKANSSLAILRLLAKQGAGFDIVSGGELERVRKAHKPALKKVVFSGVGKQAWEIDAALEADILQFNVESEQELDLLAARAQALTSVLASPFASTPTSSPKRTPTSPPASPSTSSASTSKPPAPSTAAPQNPKWLEPYGVSVHIGSQIRKVDPFAAALERVTALVAQLRHDGHDIRTIDAGGGLGIDYSDAPFDAPHQVERYAAALTKGLADEKAHLLLEPGRFLVAQAGALLTRVLVVKKNGSKTFIITDAAMNDLIRPAPLPRAPRDRPRPPARQNFHHHG